VRRQSIKVSELPTANWGALWNVMKAPLEKRKKGRAVGPGKGKVAVELDEVKASPLSSATPTPIQEKQNEKEFSSPLNQSPNPLNQFPPSPPKSVRQDIERIDSMAPFYPRPAKWEALFEEDSSTPTPTTIFVALISTVFAHLDPRHTGYLSPEVYSGFLDLQGVKTSNNICKFPILFPILGDILMRLLTGKQAFETGSGDLRRLEVADLELGLYFSDLNISHTLVIRPKISSPYSPSADDNDPPPPTPTSAVEERIKESMRFSANMPMLSRQGFIDLSALEYLRDPEAGYGHLKRGVEVLGIWKELGIPMPRSVLPEMSIPKVLRNELDDVTEEKEGHWTGDEEEDEERTSPIKFKFKGGEAKQMKIDSVISSLIPKVSAEKERGEREELHSDTYKAV
jgi:hypothetical protein